jgi:ABC-type multidrug transport system ATPase subunit
VEASVTLRNVSKNFKKKYVLTKLTLGIERNSTFAVIGRNGAGKSILLRVISTFMTPDAGEVFINGKEVTKSTLPANKCIGYLPDHDIHDCWLTGRENLRARAELLDIPEENFVAVTEPLINYFGLHEALNEYPVTYSRGTKRCLDLVMVLMADPEILVLDEPTLGLDYDNRTALFKYLLSVKDRKTIIIASNVFTEIQTLVDRWVVLDYGKIRFDGTIEKMLTKIDIPFTGEIILRSKEPQLLEKIKKTGKFQMIRNMELTIQVTFDNLKDFYSIITNIPDENISGVSVHSLNIEEFLDRILSDEGY